MKIKYSKAICLFLLFFFVKSTLFTSEKDSLIIYQKDYKPTIGLALSGGGSRGFTQIGILKVFEENNIDIDYLSGTSIGAIIGGLYASGYSATDIEEIALREDWSQMFKIISKDSRDLTTIDRKYIKDRSALTFDFYNFKFIYPSGFSSSYKFEDFLRQYFFNALYKTSNSFDNLKIPIRIASYDLTTGKSVFFSEGNLIKAIRASSSFPLQFQPVRMDTTVLVDGGMFDNVPQSGLNGFSPDIKISVINTSPLHTAVELDNPIAIADQIVSHSMKYFEKFDIDSGGILIIPNIGKKRNSDFSDLDTLILKGKAAGIVNLDRINIERKEKLKEKISNLSNISFTNNTKLIINHKDNKIEGEFEKIVNYLFDNDIEKIVIKQKDNYIEIRTILYPNVSNIKINLLNDKVGISVDEYENEMNSHFFGSRLSPKNSALIKEYLLKLFHKKRYTFARIEDFQFNSNGECNIACDYGIMEKINYFSNKSIPNYLIKRDITIGRKVRKGRPIVLKSDELIDSWNNLINNDIFHNVDFTYNYITEGGLELNANTYTISNQELNVGARIDNERNFRFSGSFMHYNILNSGTIASVDLISGDKDFHAGAKIFNNRLGYYNIGLSGYSYYNRRLYYNYFNSPDKPNSNIYNRTRELSRSEERFGFQAAVTTPIMINGRFNFGYRIEKIRTNILDSSAKSPYSKISTLYAAAEFDTENSVEFARSGYFINLIMETSIFNEVKALSYTKMVTALRYNYSFSRLTFSPMFYFGVADNTLPNEELFTLGGQNSFIGLREDALRGREKLTLGGEIRALLPFKLFFDTYASIDYIWGNVWSSPSKMTFKEMYHSMGINLSVDTPLGPLKLTSGRSLYFDTEKSKIILGKPQIYFSIGMRL